MLCRTFARVYRFVRGWLFAWQRHPHQTAYRVSHYRPALVALEQREMLGDAVGGVLLTGLALLPRQAHVNSYAPASAAGEPGAVAVTSTHAGRHTHHKAQPPSQPLPASATVFAAPTPSPAPTFVADAAAAVPTPSPAAMGTGGPATEPPAEDAGGQAKGRAGSNSFPDAVSPQSSAGVSSAPATNPGPAFATPASAPPTTATPANSTNAVAGSVLPGPAANPSAASPSAATPVAPTAKPSGNAATTGSANTPVAAPAPAAAKASPQVPSTPADTIPPGGGTLAVLPLTVPSTEGTDPGYVPVALISDADGNPFSEAYQASIDWGDGTITNGIITSSGSAFQVLGDHTYDQAGSYLVAVSVADVDGDLVTVTATASVGDAALVSGNGPGNAPALWVNAQAGVPFTAPLASYRDTAPGTTRPNQTALINWGDGHISPGVILWQRPEQGLPVPERGPRIRTGGCGHLPGRLHSVSSHRRPSLASGGLPAGRGRESTQGWSWAGRLTTPQDRE